MSITQKLRSYREPALDLSGDKVVINEDSDIFFVSDLHVDIKSDRPNYFFEIVNYLNDICDRMEWATNPVFFSLGDFSNKDFIHPKGIVYYEALKAVCDRVCRITKGKCFMVMGNHEHNNADITPTFLYMDLSSHLDYIINKNLEREFGSHKKLRRSFGSTFKTPREVWFYDTKVLLYHFDKFNVYRNFIKGDSEFLVELHHNTYVNNTLKSAVGKNLPVDLIWKKDIKSLDLNNTDVAFFGDFHIPVPAFNITNRRNTLIGILGSYGRNNVKTETHNFVYLPIIKIRRNQKPKVIISSFNLIDYKLSYNMKKKTKDLNSINRDIKSIIADMEENRQKEINIDNFTSFVFNNYGHEWGSRVYNYVSKHKIGGDINEFDDRAVE